MTTRILNSHDEATLMALEGHKGSLGGSERLDARRAAQTAGTRVKAIDVEAVYARRRASVEAGGWKRSDVAVAAYTSLSPAHAIYVPRAVQAVSTKGPTNQVPVQRRIGGPTPPLHFHNHAGDIYAARRAPELVPEQTRMQSAGAKPRISVEAIYAARRAK